jgi:cell division protein FtsI (penicillin-binding protein 3)
VRRPPVRRLVALLAFLFLSLGGILVRLAVLQVRDASAYQRMAMSQRLRVIPLPSQRGSLLDADREPLAMSLDAKDVYADPKTVGDPSGTASILAGVLKTPARKLEALLSEDTSFVYLARHVSLATAASIEKMNLPGIGFIDSSRRVYPDGSLAPQVLGFVGIDDNGYVNRGLNGLELQYQSTLAGRSGKRTVEIDPAGNLIAQGVNKDVPPVAGQDVVTTLDKELQYRAQVALRSAVQANGARGGSVIVMDPRTGDIEAMATYPWFDPNRFFDYRNQEVFQNLPITAVYEPGSVNKVVTAAAAIQDHAIPLTKRLLVPDTYQVADHVFHDAHVHPPTEMTLADIISQSSNIGTTMVAQRVGSERLYHFLERFGLSTKTGIGFPGEVDPILPNLAHWSGTSIATIAFGQGVAVTPLQMAAVYGAIANGGQWVQPRLVKGFVGPDGRYTPGPAPLRHRVISKRSDTILREILAYAVDAGTGTEAQIPGYWVAGKTGTALIPNGSGGYYSGRYIASFIGLVPASSPRLVIAAILDQPVTEYGGIASAPLFQSLARSAIARLGIASAPRLPLPPHAIPYKPGQ